jgi:hypothetical protein
MSSTVGTLIRSGSRRNPWRETPAERAAQQEIEKKANEIAHAHWDDPLWHREIAALISSQVSYGFASESFFDQYVNTQFVGEFDQVEIRETRGLKVFYTARGGYIEESQLRTLRYTMPRDSLGFHVSEFEDKLRANFAVTIQELVRLAGMRMDAEINRRLFSLLQAAIGVASPYYVNATTGMTKVHLDTALREVRDAIQPDGGGPVPVTIIGRAAMIDKISEVVTNPASLYDPGATEEIRSRGRLGVYRGANIQVVMNYVDDLGVSYIPANELWVFGGNVGQFAFFGGMRTKQWAENTSDYIHYRGRQDIGGLIAHPEQARRIVDGTITP